MKEFRIVDVRDKRYVEIIETAATPEAAALKAFNISLVRSGMPANLVCRVYWQTETDDQLNMVRLYRKAEPAP